MHHETQKERIFAHMKRYPNIEFRSIDFMLPDEAFVGYEAPTRIGDLCRLGLVEKKYMLGKFAYYGLTIKGLETDVIPKTNLIYK